MATQVGVGEVAIVPTIKGFRRAVSSEVDGSTKEAKGIFQKGFASAGTTAGNDAGKGFHGAFAGQTKGTTAALVKSLQSDVAKAAREVSTARLREQDAAGKVRVAEAQLAEARSKYASDSSQVVRAEERLQSAQRQLADRQETTRGSTEKLQSSQQKLATESDRLERELRDVGNAAESSSDELGRAGTSGASRFGANLSSGIRGAGGLIVGAVAALGIANMIGDAVRDGVRLATDYIRDSVSLASDLEQSMGAVDSVFKGNSETIKGWAADAAQSVGLSQGKYQEFATVVGAQLKNMGLPMDEVTGKTGELITLGADLAAQFGGPTSDAVTALSSLLRGERDPIERYGVTMNEASVKAEALALGLVTVTQDADKVAAAQSRAEVAQRKYNEAVAKYGADSSQALSANATLISANSSLEKAMEGTTEELTNQQKAQATLSLLYKQTADAQGTFARESDTLAGQQQRLTAEWENAQSKLGTAMLPALTELAKIANEELVPVLNDVIDKVGPELGQALSDSVPAIADMLVELAPLIPELAELAVDVLPPLVDMLRLVAPLLVSMADGAGYSAINFGGLTDLLSGDVSFQKLGQDLLNSNDKMTIFNASLAGGAVVAPGLFKKIGDGATSLGMDVANGIAKAIQWVQDLPVQAANALAGIGSTLRSSGQSLIQGFIDGIQDMIGAAGRAVSGVLDWVKGFFPHSPALRGPLSGAGWTRLASSGEAYMEQWISGVEDRGARFTLADMVRTADAVSLTGEVRGSGHVAAVRAAAGAGDTYNFNGPMYGDPEHVAEEIETKKRRAAALHGVGGIR